MLIFDHTYLYSIVFTWTYFCEIYWDLLVFKLNFKRCLKCFKTSFWTIADRPHGRPSAEHIYSASRPHSRSICTDMHNPKWARARSIVRSTATEIVQSIGRPLMSAELLGFLDRLVSWPFCWVYSTPFHFFGYNFLLWYSINMIQIALQI